MVEDARDESGVELVLVDSSTWRNIPKEARARMRPYETKEAEDRTIDCVARG
jgi:hypothetical protein